MTTRLEGVVRYGANGPEGWRAPDASTGYGQPLRVRYDPADPSLAMAQDDYADYSAYAFWAFDLILLGVGLAMPAPAVIGIFRRPGDHQLLDPRASGAGEAPNAAGT